MHYAYILASKKNGVLYVGVAKDLIRRVWEHKTKAAPGFTSKYNVDKLVWFEAHDRYVAAAQREKRLKKWKRDWKIALIEEANPDWRDLYAEICA